MKHHHKNSNIEKHRGNPHGNDPEKKVPQRKETSDDNLRQSNRAGVSKAPKEKQ